MEELEYIISEVPEGTDYKEVGIYFYQDAYSSGLFTEEEKEQWDVDPQDLGGGKWKIVPLNDATKQAIQRMLNAKPETE